MVPCLSNFHVYLQCLPNHPSTVWRVCRPCLHITPNPGVIYSLPCLWHICLPVTPNPSVHLAKTRTPPPLIYPEGSKAGCDSYGINQTFCGRQKVIKEKKREKKRAGERRVGRWGVRLRGRNEGTLRGFGLGDAVSVRELDTLFEGDKVNVGEKFGRMLEGNGISSRDGVVQTVRKRRRRC